MRTVVTLDKPQVVVSAGARPRWLAAALAVGIAASAVVAIGTGSSSVDPTDAVRYLWAALTGGTIGSSEVADYQIVWQVRTPRVLLAATVGAGLASVGVAVQALVRNALADPYVLGVSAGASVGAVAVTVLGFLSALGLYAVSAGAFLGAAGGTVLVYAIARTRDGVTPLRLVLTGVVLSFGFQALMAVMVYWAPSGEATSLILFWTMGGFGAATWATLPLVVAVVVAGCVLLGRHSTALDAMALGDETATSLGIDVARRRRLLFALTALMTGAAVAVSGAIGFLGLVVPHLARMLVGAGHRRVLLLAPLLGAVVMIWVDLVSRVLVAPRELPIGVITALVGVPVFVVLLRRRAYVFGGR